MQKRIISTGGSRDHRKCSHLSKPSCPLLSARCLLSIRYFICRCCLFVLILWLAQVRYLPTGTSLMMYLSLSERIVKANKRNTRIHPSFILSLVICSIKYELLLFIVHDIQDHNRRCLICNCEMNFYHFKFLAA